jgi:predicted dienelactone hydrolase
MSSRPMMRRHAAILLTLAACTEPVPFEPAGPDAAPDPAAMGPYPVGVRTVTIEDPSRLKNDAPRKLVTEIWYPAREAARGQKGVSYDIRTLLTEAQKEQVKGIAMPALETSAVRDAEARTDAGTFPLVVFSHGSNAVRWQSTFFTVLLASHGYVVVAPDHVGNTLEETLHGTDEPVAAAFENRPLDAVVMIDHFTDLPEGDALSGMIDPERVGISGHSYGGLTSLRTATRDDRVKAIVPMAAPGDHLSLVGEPEQYPLDIPVMLLAAHEDRTIGWDDNTAPLWSRLRKPRVLVDFVKGGHFTFADLCQFDLAAVAEAVGFIDVSNVVSDGCGPDATPAKVALPLINQFAVAFFNATLRASPGSWDFVSQAAADKRGAGATQVTVDR